MNYYLIAFIISMMFMFMDFGWILLNRNLYLGNIKNVQNMEYETTSVFYILITYIFMLLGLFIICFNFIENQIKTYDNFDKNIVAFLSGGFYGIIINSIYNLTNLVAFKNYGLFVSLLDICWAFMLYGTISIIYIQLSLLK